jgi:hypothetical protein
VIVREMLYSKETPNGRIFYSKEDVKKAKEEGWIDCPLHMVKEKIEEVKTVKRIKK